MTLIRLRADGNRADVLRGERSPLMGEVVEREDGCESVHPEGDFGCELPFGHSGNHETDHWEWEAFDD